MLSGQQLQTDLAKKKLKQELRKSKSKIKSSDMPPKARKASSSSSADVNNNNESTLAISVESFLVPRTVSGRLLLRSVCGLFLFWSILKCRQTSGVPYIRTVWQLLYGNHHQHDFVTGGIPPPAGYFPSAADVHLANLIAKAASSKTLIPSSNMPSVAPILGLVASVFAYVAFTYLLPFWSTRVRVFLDYSRINKVPTAATDTSEKARAKLVVGTKKEQQKRKESVLVRLSNDGMSGATSAPLSSSGKPMYVICPLFRSERNNNHKSSGETFNKKDKVSWPLLYDNFGHRSSCYFELNHARIYCNPRTKACINGEPMLTQLPLAELRQLAEAGGLSNEQRKMGLERYKPYNSFDLTLPTLLDAFLLRVSSPLVVIQFLGKIMSVVEEGKGALVALLESLLGHFWDARQAIQSAKQMAQEVQTNLQDTSGYEVLIFRNDTNEWVSAMAGDLIPGDMFRFGNITTNGSNKHNSTSEITFPVDALVLKGRALTNEAVLTGESVPQAKLPLDFQERSHDQETERNSLDLNAHRSSILFAGTTLLRQETGVQSGKHSSELVCLALRTGTYSSKGQILRALKGNGSVGGMSNAQADKDAMKLIGAMTMFAAVSCASLFIRKDGKVAAVSPFRRVVQCTRIVLASIPSSLPLALAAVARSCSRTLRNLSDVVCSVPGSLLTAAYVDTVVFDKVCKTFLSSSPNLFVDSLILSKACHLF